jgi:hypothetical protein
MNYFFASLASDLENQATSFLDSIAPELKLYGGAGIAALLLYLWSKEIPLSDLWKKLLSFLSPEKKPQPTPNPMPIPVPPIPVPPIPDDIESIEDMDELSVHAVLIGLAEWFSSRKDEKGTLAAISLGQHLYSVMLDELKPPLPKPKPRTSAPKKDA